MNKKVPIYNVKIEELHCVCIYVYIYIYMYIYINIFIIVSSYNQEIAGNCYKLIESLSAAAD